MSTSDVATPEGQSPVAGKMLESKTRYRIVASMTSARIAPANMGPIRSGRPMSHGTPMGSSRALALPKVAPEIVVWRRFCRLRSPNPRRTARGTRASISATMAPITELLGVIPTRVISWTPMIAPRTASSVPRTRVVGSSSVG
jgi:hypothetical protein